MKKWCSTYWLYLLYALGVGMAAASVLNWSVWTIPQRCAALNAVILPLHVIEEWRFPAGFHYQYNTLMKSPFPDRYPMNMQTDMITNLAGEILFIAMLFLADRKGVMLALMVFDFMEVLIHTILGVMMYRRFRPKGKRTIYGPGSLTAYLGHGITGLYLLFWAFSAELSGRDFGIMLLTLIAMLAGLILLPENLLKKKENAYAFPSSGYFARFLEDEAGSDGT